MIYLFFVLKEQIQPRSKIRECQSPNSRGKVTVFYKKGCWFCSCPMSGSCEHESITTSPPPSTKIKIK